MMRLVVWGVVLGFAAMWSMVAVVILIFVVLFNGKR